MSKITIQNDSIVTAGEVAAVSTTPSDAVHTGDPAEAPVVFPLRSLRAEAEIKGIQRALTLTGWNRKQAARLLKISYRGLLYKIRQHKISPA